MGARDGSYRQTERRNVIATGDSSDVGGGGDGRSGKRKDGT